MKAAFFAVALTAVAAVKAADEKQPDVTDLTPEGSVTSSNKSSNSSSNSSLLWAEERINQINSLFASEGAKIDWQKFSPEALGMSLNFEEMSEEELKKVVKAFVKLNLISPEEADTFASFLVDPRMRLMLENVTENWPETMQKIIRDPEYLDFLKGFQSNVDEQALADIVGLRDGLPGAAVRAEAEGQDKH
ncbi:hypothetical protein Emag_006024 [Eimeria magna]